MGLFTFILPFLLIGAYVVGISTNSNKFCESNDYGFSIKLTNEEDLRFQLGEKLTSILMKNLLRDITITTYLTQVDDLNPETPVPVSFSISEDTMAPEKFTISSVVNMEQQQRSTTQNKVDHNSTKTISTTPTRKRELSNPATITQNITDENELTDSKTVENSTDENHKNNGTVYLHNAATTYAGSPIDQNTETTSITYENTTSKNQTTIEKTSDTGVSTIFPDEDTHDRTTVTQNTVKSTKSSNLRDTTNGNKVETSGFKFSTTIIKSKTTKISDTTVKTDKQCEYKFESICYWTEINPSDNLNYEEAMKVCNSKDSTLALIPNSQVYNSIATMIRSRIPSGLDIVYIWTQLQIDPSTGVTIPAGVYTTWLPNHPHISSKHVDSTNVYLVVGRTSNWQGMINKSPQEEIHGMICQFLVDEIIEARYPTTQLITSSFPGLSLTNVPTTMDEKQHTTHLGNENIVNYTEEPIMNEATTGKSPDVQDDPPCEYKFESNCYWTEVNDVKMIRYGQAQEKCLGRNSTLAFIVNDEVYNKVLRLLRSKMTSEFTFFWIELQIDPLANTTTPANAYTRWYPNSPYLGSGRIDSTHVYLAVSRDPANFYQGMVNYIPTALLHGMVCQYQKN